MAVWLTIPTRHDKPDLLDRIRTTCGVPEDRQVIVDTRGTPINIQQWWRTGILVAEAGGADVVAVLNDDVRVKPDSLMRMAGALAMTDAAVCWAWPGGKPTGWAYMLNLRKRVRPDPRFRWWWGDNDLAMQAGDDWVGIDAGITHLGGGSATRVRDDLQALAAADEAAFTAKWGL